MKTPQGCTGGYLLVTSHSSAKDSISLSILIGLLDVPVVVVLCFILFNKINFAFTTHGMVKENFHINVHHKFTSKAEEITIGKVPPHPFSFLFSFSLSHSLPPNKQTTKID